MAIKLKSGLLETRLTVVMLLLTVLPAVAVGWVAHSQMYEHIRSESIGDVGRVADAKRTQLVMVLTRANDRAKSFLSNLSTQCGGNATKLNPVCAANLIKSYLAAENASGMILRRQVGGESLTIGASAVRGGENIAFKAGQLAQFSGTGQGNNLSYFISAADPAGLQLVITYPSSTLDSVFASPPENLGHSGETFLADGEGYFVTKPKYISTQGHKLPISARPMRSCLSGQEREVIDEDYRDVNTVMGFRFIPEFGAACIMAHIGAKEAFAPLESLEQRLLVSMLFFVTLLIAITVYIAKSVVRPVLKLTNVASAIATGDYTIQADAAGNDEISELAAAFNFMTSRLYEQSAHLEDLVRERTKKLEQTQQETAALLRRHQALMKNSLDGIAIMDAQGNVVEANDAFCRKLGYTREEVVSLNAAAWETQQDEEWRASFKNLIGKSAMFETLYRRKDGTLINVEVSAAGVEIDGHQYVFASSRDITARKQAEMILKQHKVVIDTSIDGFWVTDMKGNLLEANEAYARMSGYPAKELVNMHISQLEAVEQSPEEVQAHIAKVVAQGYDRFETCHRHKDGHEIDIEVSSTYMPELQRLYVFCRDITARKRAEERLQRSERSLKEAQRIAHLGSWDFDLVRNVLTWSDEIYRIFEIDPEAFGASYDAFLNAIHPEDRELVNNAYSESVKSRNPYIIAHRLLMKDGRVKYVNEMGETYYREDGTPLRSFGIVHDITELKLAEAQLAESMSLLQATNKALDEFTYIAAHDLKEPLRGIHNYTSFLKEDYGDRLDENARQYVSSIQRLAERLSALIDRLLAYSRLGSTELAKAPVDVDAVVDEVAEDLSNFWRDRAQGGMGIELRRNGPLGTVQGDATRIGEVFQNLISNAAKYNDKPLKWIEVGCDRSGVTPVFYVRDNGIGIQPHHQESIFRIFKRLHEQNKYGGGTGAGLTIAKKIIERHGGRIWLESVPEEGTVFYFTLREDA